MSPKSEKKSEKPTCLKEDVEKWLNATGVSLEHRTRQAMIDAGIRTQMGAYLYSLDEVKCEVDALGATAMSSLPDKSICHIGIVCECKYIKSKPWIGISQGDTGAGSTDLILTPQSGLCSSSNKGFGNELVELEGTIRYSNDRKVAYRIIEYRKEGNEDRVYRLLNKLSSVSWAYAQRTLPLDLYAFIVPVVVVDGPLFIGRHDQESDSVRVESVEWMQVRWTGSEKTTLFDVVTIDYAPVYFKEIYESMDSLDRIARKMHEMRRVGVGGQ